MFEKTVAIAKTTFLRCETPGGSCECIEALHGMYHISGLHSVSTYILHRRSSDLPRDSGQILHPGESLSESPFDKIRPLLSRSRYGKNSITVLVVSDDALYCRMKHESVIITYK